jgi:hypothetical protein
MEIAIPFIALGGLYFSSNKNKKSNNEVNDNKEGYVNYGKQTTIRHAETVNNYPVTNANDLRKSTLQAYDNPNQRTDKYFNKNVKTDKTINDKSKKITDNTFMSLTGEKIEGSNFEHNNMVPYFGAKIRGRSNNMNTNESILDNAVGAGSQTFNKQESAPLFKPEDNIDWAYGAPNNTDFYQSRVNPSNRMANVKPWEEERVGPGLNQGFTNSGQGGFNSGLEARSHYMPKNVDQLRVETNPKESFSLANHEGPLVSSIKNMGKMGAMEKHLPDTYYENFSNNGGSGKNFLFTTTGVEKAQTARGQIIDKDINRGECDDNIVYGGKADVLKGRAPTVYEPSAKCELGQSTYFVKEKTGYGAAREGDYGKNSFKNKRTNRECDRGTGNFGPITSGIGAIFAPIVNLINPTKKEDFIDHARTFGNKQVGVEETYVHNPRDAPNVTNREMFGEFSYNNVQRQDVTGYNNLNKPQPVSNQRDSTNIAYVGAGGGSGVSNAQSNYASAYNANINQAKECTLTGRTNGGNMSTLNHNVNMKINKQDCDRDNNRVFVPSVPPAYVPPSTETMGMIDKPNDLSCDSNMERINPDLLSAYKQNPYAQSITNDNALRR